MTRATIHCRNCATVLDDSYCPHCGQKDIDLERPLLQLVGEVLRETFEADGRVARTLVALFRRPGLLTAEFLAGRRRIYTSLFRLYLGIGIPCGLHAARLPRRLAGDRRAGWWSTAWLHGRNRHRL